MSKVKVARRGAQVKLVFGEGGPREFSFDLLMQELQLDAMNFATQAGLLVMQSFIDQEVECRAGARQTHTTEVNRWGAQRGSVVLNGQKAHFPVQRLRTRDGKEVTLESYERFRDPQVRTEEMFHRMVAGVSCRDYAGTVEAVADGYGVSKSVVSREGKQATSARLRELCERDLSTLDVCAIMIDGVKIGPMLQVVVKGFDSEGKKHILGFRQGSTENAETCMEVFHDLVRRQLKLDHPILVIVDGSPALRKAVDAFLGTHAVVQRCLIHKVKNVLDKLPKHYHAEYKRKIDAAYGMNVEDDARRAFLAVIRELHRICDDAAECLAKDLDELLTLHRLGLPPVLRKTFSTTNSIESAFSYLRKILKNVKRWRRTTDQIQRWTGTGLLMAEKRFRRIKGYRSLPVLIAALEAQSQRNQQRTIAA